MKLRPYQERIIEEIRAHFRTGIRSVLVQSPTGSGKTCLTAHMLKKASERGHRCMFFVHRRELILQSSKSFSEIGIDHGIIAPGFSNENNKLIQIVSIPTICRRLHKIDPPHMAVFDEAHHSASKTWKNVYDWCANSYHVGLSATPVRLDGKGLGELFDVIVKGPRVSELIEQGFLSDYKMFCPSNIDSASLHKRCGDYIRSEVESQVLKASITGKAVNEYKAHAMGKRAIVFTVSVKHAKHVAESFNEAGISARAVDGTTPKDERDRAFAEFYSGKVPVLCNCELACEGVDIPGAEVAILMRPTLSVALYLQQVGRVLRPAEGKSHAVILDHVGNAMRHGLPCDDREFSLDGIKKKERDTEGSVRVCKHCFYANPPRTINCNGCGEPLADESKKRKPPTVDETGTLSEIDKAAFQQKKKTEQASAKSLEDLVSIGISRGYKNPRYWAMRVMSGRKAKRSYVQNRG